MSYFNSAYYGKPPWDIDRPQHVFVDLEKKYNDFGTILDIGCGTGELSIFFTKKGYKVTGLDSSSVAIALAKQKAANLNLKIEFLVENALTFSKTERKFNSIIDSGLFHVFSDFERNIYVKSMYDLLKFNGRLFILCFSDKEPPGYGPRRITKKEIYSAFINGWKIISIVNSFFETNFTSKSSKAWFITIKKEF